MKTISVCMIVKDEEHCIERILRQAKKFADEIIIVDTYSEDKTPEIALKYTNRVYKTEFQDFSQARNYSLSLAESDYVMWLDADDVLPDESVEKLIALKNSLGAQDMIMLPYETAFDEDGNPTFRYFRERILRNRAGYVFEGAVHEAVAPRGEIEYLDIPIRHQKEAVRNPFRNLGIYQKLIADGAELCPREKFYYACELYYNRMYDEALAVFNVFLKGGGMTANVVQALLNSSDIYIMKGMFEEGFAAAAKALYYVLPTPAVCCQLGYCLQKAGRYGLSTYYYGMALTVKETDPLAFRNTDFDAYVPYIEMGLNSYYDGDVDKAIEYTLKAKEIRPNSALAESNLAYYFEEQAKTEKIEG